MIKVAYNFNANVRKIKMVPKSNISMSLIWKVKGNYKVIRCWECFLASQSPVIFMVALFISALKFIPDMYI